MQETCKTWLKGVGLGLAVGIVIGSVLVVYSENKMLGDYDLYQCIYNNADMNDFPQNPVMIQKIQDECVCFRKYGYIGLLDVDCTNIPHESTILRVVK